MTGEVWLLIAVGSLTLVAILSSLAQSLRELSRPALEEIAAIRNKPTRSARIRRILDDPEGHAAAIALPRVIGSLFVAIALVMYVAEQRGGNAPEYLDVLVGAVVASLLLWVFGTALPASVAKHAGEATVYTWSGVLRIAYVLFSPLRALARGVDEVVRRLAGQELRTDAQVIEQEILSVVEEAQEEGKFDEAERDMIEAVVRFRNKTVAQIMTPRTEVEAMPLTNDLSAVTATIRDVSHSRIPVYEDSLDHVVGVFYVKDLMRWLAGESSRGGKTFDFRALLRPALFVPETKTVRELLSEMLKRRLHIALVADEYGGTAGLVTIEDIVEEVFGDIQDEYELPEEQSADVRVDVEGKAAEIDARAYITDVNDAIRSLGVELPESEDYDTVGGFVTVTLGRIPAKGETLRHDGVLVTVLGAEPTRVTRVKVEAKVWTGQPHETDVAERN